MKSKILCFIAISLLSFNVFSQEKEEDEGKNLLIGTLGYTYISSASSEDSEEADGIFITTLGIDYFRKIHSKWELGIMADLELGEYVVINKDLNRENALLITGMASYKLTDHVNLLAGAGLEIEKHENLAIIRLGTEYAINLKKEWSIPLGFFYDFKEGINTWSLSIGIGKEF